jgi:hypothetical protein
LRADADDLLAETESRAPPRRKRTRSAKRSSFERDRQKAMLGRGAGQVERRASRAGNLSKQFDANEVTLADLEASWKGARATSASCRRDAPGGRRRVGDRG